MELKINSKTYGEQIVLIDDNDYDIVKNFKWRVVKQGNKFYVQAHNYQDKKDHNIFIHRLIMNFPENKVIDHINNNPLDNRRENLRICSHAENLRNMKKDKIKGVWFDKSRNKYMTYIMFNYKRINLGRYDSEIEAIKVYNNKAKELFGEFANLNNIDEVTV